MTEPQTPNPSETPIPAPVPATAPTPGDFGSDLAGSPPAWPKVIGILSIVWAAMGVLCSGIGITFILVFAPGMAGDGDLPPSMTATPLQWAFSGLGLIAIAILLFGGIGCLRRVPSGRTLHLSYGVLGLVLALGQLYIGIQNIHAMDAWRQANPDSPFAQGSSETEWIGLVLVLAVTSAWPLFCILWFGAMNKRPEVGRSNREIV